MIRTRLIVIAMSALSCIHDASGQASPATKTFRESLLRADRALSSAAFESGIKAALAGAMTDDALLLYEGAPVVRGKENVAKLLDAQSALNGLRVHWLPLVVTTSDDGSIGATWGVTSITPSSPDYGGMRFARYISAWRRSADGAWQLVAHIDLGLVEGKTIVPEMAPLSARDALSGKGAPFAQADIEFARQAGTSGAPSAFAAFAAADAMTLAGSGEIVVGPPAIELRMLESPLATAKWEWHPVYSEGSGAGDFGFTVGEATITAPAAAADGPYHGKYLTIWRRQIDGSLRFIVDGGNSR